MSYNCSLCGKVVEGIEPKKIGDKEVCYNCYDKIVYTPDEEEVKK